MDVTLETLIIRVNGDVAEETGDRLAAEIAFSLDVNGQRIVSLLCTPSDLDCMAVGFLLSEGLLSKRELLLDLQVNEAQASVGVTLKDLPVDWQGRFHRKTITSGCGQGVTFSDSAQLRALPPIRSSLAISPAAINELLREFRGVSDLFHATGGVHSAALSDGKSLLFHTEDIGRHNAVDKLIGKAFLAGIPVDDKIVFSSGRVSGEVMTKMIRSRIPILVSRAAPTCMAVAAAEDHGITLIGFARGQRMNVYTHPQRVDFSKISRYEDHCRSSGR